MERTNDPVLLVLGSAAAEGLPALFCDCRVCREALAKGAFRARSSYNFGGDVQIDLGPDGLQAWQKHHDVLRRMRHVLVTHAHEDHLQPSDLIYKSRWFAGVPAIPDVLTVHGTAPTRARIENELWLGDETFEEKFRNCGLAFHRFKPFDTFELDSRCAAAPRSSATTPAGCRTPRGTRSRSSAARSRSTSRSWTTPACSAARRKDRTAPRPGRADT